MTLWRQLERISWQQSGRLSAWGERGYGFCGKADPAPAGVHHARQVHGTRIVTAQLELTSDSTSRRVEADGLLSLTPGVKVGVKTADCLPVLLRVPQQAACAVHAGWRGLVAGILGEAVAAVTGPGLALSSVQAAIGPAIGREAFEVGDEVVKALGEGAVGFSSLQTAFCLAKGQGDRWHVDLQLAAVLALLNAGLDPAQISVAQICTYRTAQWHSYRRDGKGHGSNWSWVEP